MHHTSRAGGERISGILVTGGSGFIGSALARHFAEEGFRVSTLDVRPPAEPLKALEIQHFVCDLTDYAGLENCFDGVDLAIHTAILQIPEINERRREGFEANVLGTENLCRLVDASPCQGLLLAGSWHVIGESGLRGVVTEGFGYRPDKVEDRARLYALSKITQELIVRQYGEFSDKVFGILRLGTVLGEGMPPGTAASTFIGQAVGNGELTPYRHSMHRPMAYVSIRDVLEGFTRFANMILAGEYRGGESSLSGVANLLYPEPVTILELANLIRDAVVRVSDEKVRPEIRVVDKGLPELFEERDRGRVKFDTRRSKELLGFDRFISPAEEIERIVRGRLERTP